MRGGAELQTVPSNGHVTTPNEREHSTVEVNEILAVLALSKEDQMKKVPWILQISKIQNHEAQFASAWVLGRIKLDSRDVNKVVDRLLQNLFVENEWIRGQSATSLGLVSEGHTSSISTSRKDEGRDSLLKLARHPNPWLRERAILALLPWHNQPSVQEALSNGFRDIVPIVRDTSIRAGLDVNSYLPEAATDEDPGVRYLAVHGIRRMDSSQDSQKHLLVERLRDPYDPVVAEALHELTAMGDPKMVQPILDVLNLGWRNVVQAAIQTLTGKTLEEVISQTNWKPSRPYERNAPVKMRSRPEVQEIVHGALSGDHNEKLANVAQLTWVDTPEAHRTLSQSLNDSDPFVRFITLKTILRRITIGMNASVPNEFLEPLIRSLNDPNFHVTACAAEVWGHLLGLRDGNLDRAVQIRVLPQLHHIAAHHSNGFVRAAASEALVRAESRNRLFWEKQLEDPFMEVRELAQTALANMYRSK